jgi:hypothetical protein
MYRGAVGRFTHQLTRSILGVADAQSSIKFSALFEKNPFNDAGMQKKTLKSIQARQACRIQWRAFAFSG